MANSKDADVKVYTEMTGYAAEMTSRKMKLANGVTAEQITKKVDATGGKLKAIAGVKAQLATLVDEKNALCKDLLDLRKKLREGVKGVYGDNSAEYQAVGGVRASERKKPVRKPK